MKKLMILVAVVAFNALQTAHAQDELEPSKRERLEALKVAYLTQELSLTPEEAQQFWPLYNEMAKKLRDIRKEQRGNRMDAKENFDSMSDAELSAAIDKELAYEQQELDLKKEYNAKFKKILPIKKVAKLHASEKGFRKELLKGARDKRKIPGGPPH
jgi:tellurite resistance protein